MTKFTFRRSEMRPNLEDVELETPLNERQLELIEEVKQLESNPALTTASTTASGPIRDYKTKHSVPYGYNLNKEKVFIMNKIKAALQFLNEKMQQIRDNSIDCHPVALEIRDKLTQIIEVDEN